MLHSQAHVVNTTTSPKTVKLVTFVSYAFDHNKMFLRTGDVVYHMQEPAFHREHWQENEILNLMKDGFQCRNEPPEAAFPAPSNGAVRAKLSAQYTLAYAGQTTLDL